MNWQFVLLQLIALVGLVSFTVALVYYLRHRHAREQVSHAQRQGDGGSTGGEFLKRYVPPEHRRDEDAPRAPSLFASRLLFYSTCLVVPTLVLVFTTVNWYAKRESFLEEIVYEDSEAADFPIVRHDFDARLNAYAPDLDGVSEAVDGARNLVVMRPLDNSDATAVAWLDLLQAQGLPTSGCYYGRLRACKIYTDTTLIVSLAEIDPKVLNRLIAAGVDIIAYGFPESADDIDFAGLRFADADKASGSHLALVGDRELTLGMDAGLNMDVAPIRRDMIAYSDRPQAIGMFSDRLAGGTPGTRLFATQTDGTRVVWMDFAVAEGQWLPDESRGHFESLLAGILRYASHQTFESISTWPEGRAYGAFFEEDTEDGYVNAARVADVFAAADVPLTWYVLSDLATQHRELTQRLSTVGEMACHGDNHDIMPRYDIQGQVTRLARCMSVVETVTGKRPSGFRPPTEAHNLDTFSAMINVGMTHVFAESATPTQVPHFKQVVGGEQRLVSMPRAISDDFYLWHYLKLDPQASLERLQQELRWIQAAGSLYAFSFHTQFMDDDENLAVVRRLVDDIGSDDSAWVDTVGGIADWWDVRDRLVRQLPVSVEELERFSPVRLLVGEEGRVIARPLTAANSRPDDLPVVLAGDDAF